jgi:hypothetical protein
MAELEEEVRQLILPVEPEAAEAEWRRERRNSFWTWAGLSVLVIGYLIWKPPTFSTWRDWFIVGGAIFFPVLAIVSFISMRKEWTPHQEDWVFRRTLGYMILGPILLVAIVIGGILLYSAFGWLGTIPSWAAVIIVLLVLILLK